MTQENTALLEALEWYGEQARLARLIHSEGDAGRHALAEDGGKKAKAVLAALSSPTQSSGACATCGKGEGYFEHHPYDEINHHPFTPTTDSLTADATVTPADKALYAKIAPDLCAMIYGGDLDSSPEMQAIVKHRHPPAASGEASLPLPAQTVPADVAAEAPGDVTDAPADADGELCKLLDLIETADEHGDECAIVEQAAKVRAALAQPKGGE